MSHSLLAVSLAFGAFSVLAGGPAAHSEDPHRLADLVGGPGMSGSSSPGAWIEAGKRAFFIADQHALGPEVWVTDGTAAGTHLLADAAPGDGSERPELFGIVDGRLLWWSSTEDERAAGQLWVSDGTPAGTRTLLPDEVGILSFSAHRPESWDLADGVLHFAACGSDGCALWRSDGTPGGTQAVHPFSFEQRPGADEVAAAGGHVFFTVDGALWSVDADGEGTRLVDGESGARAPDGLVAVGPDLYFAYAPAFGTEQLWISDGTPEGTRAVTAFGPEGRVRGWLKVVGARLYFLASEDGSEGYEIWKTEGTPETTAPVTGLDFYSALDALRGPQDFAVAGQRVFVIADRFDEVAEVRITSLFVSDGTPSTTRDLLPCAGPCPRLASGLAAVGARVLFVLEIDGRYELWRSDGTPAGTGPVVEICSGGCVNDPPTFREIGGEIAFAAERRVWLSDGTVAGTRAITPADAGRAAYGGEVGHVGGCWLYPGEDERGIEPWCSHGTPTSARLVRDIEREAAGSDPREFLAVGGRAVFSALDETGVRQVWSSDGRAGSVRRLTSSTFNQLPLDRDLFAAGDFALFRADLMGPRTWRTDGTLDGTWPVGDLDRRSDVILDGRVFSFGFVGEQAGLWEVDGSPDGLRLAVPFAGSQDLPLNPAVVGDLVYFVDVGDTLRRSDGTPAGTFRVAQVAPGAQLSQRLPIAGLGGFAYYVVDPPGLAPDEIWRTDGRHDSAELLATIPHFQDDFDAPGHGLHAHRGALFFATEGTPEGGQGSTVYRLSPAGELTPLVSSGGRATPPRFVSIGDDLYFTFHDGVHGVELWRSDGTPAGTRMVTDLHRGGSSVPFSLTAAGDRLFFSAASDRYGRELWRLDPDGQVRLVSDLAPGALSSEPRDLALVGDTLFFSADDGETGREPWALSLADSGPPPPPPGPFLTSAAVPGFRFKVRITGGATSLAGRMEPSCIPETLCVSGAVPGRSEVFLRVVGPKPNGRLWPTLVKFSTSRVEVWVEQQGTGEVRYYDLAPAAPGFDRLPGLFDRQGFVPTARVGGSALERSRTAPMAPRADEWLTSPEVPGFRFRVAISGQPGQEIPGRLEGECIEETACLSGAVPGRSELFLRMVGPKPNGHLWPTLVRFSTSTLDVWIEQIATGVERHYTLEGATPGSTDLSGLFDREGFLP